jgi:hypothetical protein
MRFFSQASVQQAKLADSFLVSIFVVCSWTAAAGGQQVVQAQEFSQYPRQQYPGYQQPIYQNPSVYGRGSNVVVTSHWTTKLQPNKKEHDFGAVPRYSKQEFNFEFVNTLDQDLHLVGIRTSCNCTAPAILTPVVKPGETARVLARFESTNINTNQIKEKQATLTLTVRKDRPYVEIGELQFVVRGRVRVDVVLDPGMVSFGDVVLGGEARRTLKILYAGNPNWQIVDVLSTNPNLKAERKEVQRNLQTRRVDYELTITIGPEQPVGSFDDQLTLVTNDTSNQQMSFNVQGHVNPAIRVSPVKLGIVPKNQKVTKSMIVRGDKPFTIRRVSSGDERVHFSPDPESKTLHILDYTVDTSTIGQIATQITIETDNPGQSIATVPFEVQIVPETVVKGQ